MAVAHRASAAASTTNPTTTFACTIPAGVLTDDILVLLAASRGSTGLGSLGVTDTDTGGNAWALAGNNAAHTITVWWKRATAATAGKVATLAGAVNSSAGGVSAFTGALASGNPFTNFVSEANASGAPQHAGFTPDFADSFICLGVVQTVNDLAVVGLAAATLGTLEPEFFEKLSTGGSDCAAIFCGKLSVGGPTGTGTFSWTDTEEACVSISFAIRPAVAAGGKNRLIGGNLINRSTTAGRLVA